jgi:hypothetical protein
MRIITKFQICAGIFAVALAVNAVLALKLGINVPMEGDALQFLSIAKNLAVGKGYVSSATFWPKTQTMQRLPGWPFLISLGLGAFPSFQPDLVMRCLNIVINACIAPVIAMLSLALFSRGSVAVFAGMIYTFHPTGFYLAYDGDSEPLFVLLVGIATLLLMKSRVFEVIVSPAMEHSPHSKEFEPNGQGEVGWVVHRSRYVQLLGGFSFFGLACLIRVSFVLWLSFFVLIIYFNNTSMPRQFMGMKNSHKIQVLCLVTFSLALFLAPTFMWACRNYAVSGKFPVLSTLRGQTFYGGNNAVVMHERAYWGYWVFPNRIPGETKLADLSRTMSEVEVDRYYFRKGLEYVRGNIPHMPVLLIGKLVRAYVPVPWKLSIGTGILSAYRWGLYILAGTGILWIWKRSDPAYRMALSAMVYANIATVLIFWGCARFSFEIEPFLIPFSAFVFGGLPNRQV